MFTGIIEDTATLIKTEKKGTNLELTFKAKIGNELKVDQSVAHNGVCLTVESVSGDEYTLTAIDETLNRTNIGQLKSGDIVNLERCLKADGRFDGHIVQGHVDQTGKLKSSTDQNGSYLLEFEYDESEGNITVEKGSICINGISLTVVDSTENGFSVAIIPYTWEHTNLSRLSIGDSVNLEFDILGKYMQKILKNRH
ncbi:riboflavin synthase [Jiulongibacter sp. NS-SX5]|uniref:riboflavin synthase n=1 Tax=Jiulongibacter sp. NS-SX5 TaxID=3463854 RepID=UPI0040595568